MSVVLLIHGAFRGGWAWRSVAPLLVAEGHQVHAPSLTGMGELRRRRAVDDDGRALPVSLTTWVDDVHVRLEERDLRDVVLVGHSQGGVVALAASASDCSRVRSVVLLDSPVPGAGQSAADVLSPEARASWGEPPPPDAWLPPMPVSGREWASTPELAAWVNARLCPSPARPGYDPIVVSDPRWHGLPRHYIFCSRTPASYPSSVSRARLEAQGEPVILIDAGHDAPLTDPALVAATLLPLVA